MKTNAFLILILALVTVSCNSSKPYVEGLDNNNFSKEQKILIANLNEEGITIVSDWAMPLLDNTLNDLSNSGLLGIGNNASRINLIGNQNYLTIKNDSIIADLPYYGVRTSGGGYNTDTGIEINQPLENYQIKSGKKNTIVITLDASSGTESYDITLRLNAKTGYSSIFISSTQRRSISYTGSITDE